MEGVCGRGNVELAGDHKLEEFRQKVALTLAVEARSLHAQSFFSSHCLYFYAGRCSRGKHTKV